MKKPKVLRLIEIEIEIVDTVVATALEAIVFHMKKINMEILQEIIHAKIVLMEDQETKINISIKKNQNMVAVELRMIKQSMCHK